MTINTHSYVQSHMYICKVLHVPTYVNALRWKKFSTLLTLYRFPSVKSEKLYSNSVDCKGSGENSH